MRPLDGPRLKIERAISHIDELDSFELALWKRHEYRIYKAEINPDTTEQVYRVRTDASPVFPAISVPVGEIAHNLRSALDGLVYQLAILNGRTEPKGTQFPIFLVGRSAKPESRSFEKGGRGMIRKLSLEHQGRLEVLQPYKRSGLGRSNPLWQLHEINNADKHRLLQVVAGRWGGGPVFGWSVGGTPPIPRIRNNTVLKNGAKLFETRLSVDPDSTIFPMLVFWDGCPAVKWRPLRSTLRGIANHVSEILRGFEPEFAEWTLGRGVQRGIAPLPGA